MLVLNVEKFSAARLRLRVLTRHTSKLSIDRFSTCCTYVAVKRNCLIIAGGLVIVCFLQVMFYAR